jgi:nitrous oxidase accessory protein
MKKILFILLLLYGNEIAARTLKAGREQQYKTVSEAIKAATEKDSILVYPGIYKEGNLVIAKPLRIIGINQPVFDGEGKYEIFTISTSDVILSGMVLQNAGTSVMRDYAAIKIIDAQNITIQNNTILDAYFAIHCANSTGFTIRNNTIIGKKMGEQNSGNGIHLWKCSQALIEHNEVSGHRDGIYFEFVTGSMIRKNISRNNIRYGLHFMFSHQDSYMQNTFHGNGAGVAVMYSHGVTMEQNHFENNWGASAYGILLKDISDSRIINNTFLKNTTGLYLEGTSRIAVEHNVFSDNGWAVRIQASCNENAFTANNFFSNSFDVATNGSLVLNTFNRNYWDKYKGYDLDRNNLGDVPYHPVTLYSMVVERNPNTLVLMNSFMVNLMDEAEKALPSLTPVNLADLQPLMKPVTK